MNNLEYIPPTIVSTAYRIPVADGKLGTFDRQSFSISMYYSYTQSRSSRNERGYYILSYYLPHVMCPFARAPRNERIGHITCGNYLYIMRQITHYWICTHKIFIILLRGNSLIFFQNYFCNNSIYCIYIRRVCKYMVDVRSASRGVWQDHADFIMS